MNSFDISVVIPLYKAAGYLPGLLHNLEAQTFPLDRFEVILVDDLSPDDMRAVAEGLQKASPLNLQLVWREENGGVSAARNSGWQAARSGLILFIDQDCLPDPALVTSHYQVQTASPERVAVVGRIVWSPEYKENPASEYYKATYFPSWDMYQSDGPNFPLFITSNASVPKATLEEIGGFDERFRHNYEDIACGYRLESEAGCRVTLCPEALIYHHRPLPIEEMFRRTFVAGREMARLFKHYPALTGHSITLNPAQALDWGYRLATLESLLSETLDQLPAHELAQFLPFTSYAGQYLLEVASHQPPATEIPSQHSALSTQRFFHPSSFNYPLPDNADQLYRETLLAQRSYQRELNRVRRLEARWQVASDERQATGFRAALSGWSRKLARLKEAQTDILEGFLVSQADGETELNYATQTRQLARRLQGYEARAGRLAELEKDPASRAARLLAAARRPVAPENLVLLYDTLKEYPMALGMAQGLAEIFDIQSYNELKTQPLFADLYRQWEQERAAYFGAQLARVQSGRTELAVYAQRLETALQARA
jgi:GT2 family glycosyltransferase